MRHHYSREQVQALVALTGDADKAGEILRTLGAVSGLWYLEHAQRIQYARRLLDTKTPRREIVQRLTQRFAIGQRQAHRDVTEALNCHRQNL